MKQLEDAVESFALLGIRRECEMLPRIAHQQRWLAAEAFLVDIHTSLQQLPCERLALRRAEVPQALEDVVEDSPSAIVCNIRPGA